MCQFFIKSIDKADKLNGEIINLGYPGYISGDDLANKVKKIIPKLNNYKNKKIDNRTYKVSFDKAFKLFKDEINFD